MVVVDIVPFVDTDDASCFAIFLFSEFYLCACDGCQKKKKKTK